MIVVFTLNHKDASLALKQAQWIADMGGVRKHEAIVACNKTAYNQGLQAPVVKALEGAFSKVETFVPYDEEERLDPPDQIGLTHGRPANHMFKRVVQFITNFKGDRPFLWMESDAVPLAPQWLDRIESEYQLVGKPFMGDYVNIAGIPPHMSGIAIYRELSRYAPDYSMLTRLAFDVALSKDIIGYFALTQFIQHEWKPEPFVTKEDLKRIRPGALIYHQDKSGAIIDLLRGGETATRPNHLGETAGSTPAPAISEPVAPLSIAERMRFHCAELAGIVEDKHSRKQTLHNELRKVGLLGKEKARKAKA